VDKGHWSLFQRNEGELAGVSSSDFTHDVVLYVNGDFATAEQYRQYCEWLAAKLNAVQPEGEHRG